ncbi:MAG: YlxR family protein [Clostridia bacterium]|nr:YlxR family protein [Clostridia bacterium]
MKPRKIPMRMCVGCREMKPKRELLRVVRSPEGEISFDLTGRKPGRGAYVCRSAACFDLAVRKKQLERAFSAPVSEEVRQGLLAQIADLPAPAEEDDAGE